MAEINPTTFRLIGSQAEVSGKRVPNVSVSVSAAVIAGLVLAGALDAQVAAADTGLDTGKIWVDTSSGPAVLKGWDGASWSTLPDGKVLGDVVRPVSDYADLKALWPWQLYGQVSVGGERGGRFEIIEDTAPNVTAQLAADPREGVHVALDHGGGVKYAKRIMDGSRLLNALWFGCQADGSAPGAFDNAPVIQDIIAYIGAYSVDGGSILFPAADKTYQVSTEVTLNVRGLWIMGEGLTSDGGINSSGKTIFEGTGLTKPIFRGKVDRLRLCEFGVVPSAERAAAARITADNYGSMGLTRDDQNFGIWFEPDDVSGSAEIGNFHIDNVWVRGQPNSNWVVCGKTYLSAIRHSGSQFSGDHGWCFDKGTYTGRTYIESTGIVDFYGCESYQNKGHGLACGHKDDESGPSTFRLTVTNFDSYTNGQDPARLYQPYDTYFISDNSKIEYSAFNGNNIRGGIYVAGLGIELINNRYLDMAASLSPVMADGTHCIGAPRTTFGVKVWGGYVTSAGTCTYFVNTQNAPKNLQVEVDTLTGAFGSASTTDAMILRKQNALTWRLDLTHFGDVTRTGNTTQTGGFTIAEGVMTLNRTNNVPLIVNRNGTSGDQLLWRKDGVTVGSVSESGGNVAYGTFTGIHWTQLLGHEAIPDIKPGTIISTINAMCAWKWAIARTCVQPAKVLAVPGGSEPGAEAAQQQEHDLDQLDEIEEGTVFVSEGEFWRVTHVIEPAKLEDHMSWYSGELGDGEIWIDDDGREHLIMEEENRTLAMSEISSKPGDKAVYGVFFGHSNDNGEPDFNVASLGEYFIRIAPGETVEPGDLIDSNGDGCGRVQADDIMRSSTVAKVTAAIPVETYEDGSYLVPCTLHCG